MANSPTVMPARMTAPAPSVSYVQRTAKSFENSNFATLPWSGFASFTEPGSFCRWFHGTGLTLDASFERAELPIGLSTDANRRKTAQWDRKMPQKSFVFQVLGRFGPWLCIIYASEAPCLTSVGKSHPRLRASARAMRPRTRPLRTAVPYQELFTTKGK